MHFGVSMFHTDYSIPAVELAQALEARGFESMWAPEHSHIPVSRRTPFPAGVNSQGPIQRSWTRSSSSAPRRR